MITKKTDKEIAVLRAGGKILADIMDNLCSLVKPGITTGDLEELACRLIAEAGGRPAQKNFDMSDGRVFPTALITCLNDEVVHAPSLPARELKNGDILTIDFVMEYPIYDVGISIPTNWPKNPHSLGGGYYTDMSRTVPVGKISKENKKLLQVTQQSLELAIATIKPGASLGDIGRAIQPYAESQGLAVVRDLVGHGVGYSLHEEPNVPNYIVNYKKEIILTPGMVLAIEPMIATGSYKVKEKQNSFAYCTVDGKPSAHFEHTIAVTKTGYQILTIN